MSAPRSKQLCDRQPIRSAPPQVDLTKGKKCDVRGAVLSAQHILGGPPPSLAAQSISSVLHTTRSALHPKRTRPAAAQLAGPSSEARENNGGGGSSGSGGRRHRGLLASSLASQLDRKGRALAQQAERAPAGRDSESEQASAEHSKSSGGGSKQPQDAPPHQAAKRPKRGSKAAGSPPQAQSVQAAPRSAKQKGGRPGPGQLQPGQGNTPADQPCHVAAVGSTEPPLLARLLPAWFPFNSRGRKCVYSAHCWSPETRWRLARISTRYAV